MTVIRSTIGASNSFRLRARFRFIISRVPFFLTQGSNALPMLLAVDFSAPIGWYVDQCSIQIHGPHFLTIDPAICNTSM